MERLTFNVASTRAGGPALVVGRRPIDTAPRRPIPSRLAKAKARLAAVTREKYDWDYLWMIAFTAMLFFRPQDHFPVLEPLHLAELTAIAGLAAMAARRMASGQSITRVNAEVVGMLALGAVIVVTIPFSFWPSGSLALFSDIYVKIILIFALMMSTLTTPKRLYQATWLMIIACGYVSTRGVIDYARGVNLMEGNRLRGAVGGFLENPNDLALNLVAFMAPTLFFVFQERKLTRRLFALAIAVVMFAAIVGTKSRAGFLGLGVMLVIVLYYMLRDRPGVIFALIFAAMLALPAMPSTFWDRMASITDAEADQSGSRQQRIQLYRQAMQVFAENPLTGIGAGQFQNYDGPMMIERWRVTHNAWLQIAAELGIFGLWAFGFLVWRAFSSTAAARRAIRPPPKQADGDAWTTLTHDERRLLEMNAKGMMAGLVGWAVCAFFASVAFNWTFYYLLALAVAGRDIAVARRVPRARRGAAATTGANFPGPPRGPLREGDRLGAVRFRRPARLTA